ncbi:Bug family tripartite tricarboxylate transporter substrate binding protein [Muricoccus aerilatus]|uniref:Bug family tripartite tricarboxylate transporter substrate binding protein n=1 Tax=Muricoccus aerilatus TaxID=452982 RepID=UPI0005C190C3|nr:tripartite tricarboxylate transporter substrate-binding protein [Roseomonas aerilata]
MQRRTILAGLPGILGAGTLGRPALAQLGFPERPLRLVVGFAPGGPTDLVARVAARTMSAALGQTVVVENRPGASGGVAAGLVARAPADGYTLLVNVVADVVNPVIEPATREPLLKSLAPVALVGTAPNVLVLHPSLGANGVAEVVEIAKRRPGTVSYASAGVGTVSHLSGVLLSAVSGAEMIHVPYNGTAAAQTDLLTGRISMMFDNLDNGLSNARAGKLKAVAVTGQSRWFAAPEVPTMADAGFPGSEMLSVFGVMAPVGTPTPIVERLAAGLVEGSRTEATRQSLHQISIEPASMGPAEYGGYIAAETARWEALAAQGRLGEAAGRRPQ